MQCARFIRTLGLVLVLGLVGFGGGCGPESRTPAEQEKANEVTRQARKGTHQQLDADLKKAREASKEPGDTRKAAHAGRGQ
jgi:hypothetical protein